MLKTRHLFFLLLAVVLGCLPAHAQVTVPPEATPARPLDLSSNPDAKADKLYGQIWMELAPEYRALCHQAFNAALLQIATAVSSAPEVSGQPVGASGKPLAVVVDLDETILDNSGYQQQLALASKEYSSASWAEWVKRVRDVRLVPGAKRFIDNVEAMGVTMIYLSNRRDSLRQYTVETMTLLGIDTTGLADPDEVRLLLRGEDSEKEARREAAALQYDLIAFVGDNIGDFPQLLGNDHEERLAGVERFVQLWGTRWFVLPNPVYGSWTDHWRDRDPREVLSEQP